MVLWSVDFQVTVIAVGPEPTGLVEKAPGPNGAAELSMSAVWGGSGERGNTEKSEVVV